MTNPVPMTRLPQSVQGGSAARSGTVVSSATRYNNNDALEQRRVGRNTPVAGPTHTHFPLPASSYPRRSSNSSACKNDTVETTMEVSGNGLQSRPPYIPRKVAAAAAAAQSGPGSQWY
ncbi:hypothetical protein M8C21_000700 [Ambrosia artemisiifolia]|uniref:Uncharacterized protein n=1 Tax=Ambrosia artemisiifolia TaxID=4212 RepID=A0AAD5GGL9_AMBAR|nr:hypothetical protein M8C21_000700 [Ambrosia artemisiifolia]